jgi:hypothetical protein
LTRGRFPSQGALDGLRVGFAPSVKGQAVMIFVFRAAIVLLVTFASALAGFGMQWLLPASYVAESGGMIGSVVGLDATLLALVLGLLI